MWLERTGILLSLVGFLLIIPEVLYGIIGIQKLDQLRAVALHGLRALPLLEKWRHRFIVSQQRDRSYTDQAYDRSKRTMRVVLGGYLVFFMVTFLAALVAIIVGNVTHNSKLELISFVILFVLLLIWFLDYLAGSRGWKELLVRPVKLFGFFIEGLWPLCLVLALVESGLRRLFAVERNFRLGLVVAGIFLNIVGLIIQFSSTFR